MYIFLISSFSPFKILLVILYHVIIYMCCMNCNTLGGPTRKVTPTLSSPTSLELY